LKSKAADVSAVKLPEPCTIAADADADADADAAADADADAEGDGVAPTGDGQKSSSPAIERTWEIHHSGYGKVQPVPDCRLATKRILGVCGGAAHSGASGQCAIALLRRARPSAPDSKI
jgi:hypothetical protein